MLLGPGPNGHEVKRVDSDRIEMRPGRLFTRVDHTCNLAFFGEMNKPRHPGPLGIARRFAERISMD